MKAWLERVRPEGDDISLPDGSGAISFGRSARSTIVIDEPRAASKHVEVKFDAGFWRARDLETKTGTLINGRPLRYPRVLYDRDLIEVGLTQIRFRAEEPADNPALCAAVIDAGESLEPWLIYGDWLIEQGDPLGERLALARTDARLDHEPWLGPMWSWFVSGQLEVEWHLGFIRAATIRPTYAGGEIDWRDGMTTLLGLRVAKFLRALTVDAQRLDEALMASPFGLLAEAQTAESVLATAPRLPHSLERVSFGYLLEDAPSGRVFASQALVKRAPRLEGTQCLTSAPRAALRQLSLANNVTCSGFTESVRRLNDVMRIRKATPLQWHFETPPRTPSVVDGNPCFFELVNKRWRLHAGRLRGELRVNNRVDQTYVLLPGDVIELQNTGRFRFEVAP